MGAKRSKRGRGGQISLQFPDGTLPGEMAFSAAARVDDTLFVADDESASLIRLSRDGAGWRAVETHALSEYVDLPGGPEDEIDIEGMAVHEGWLWVVGSHALVREKPEDGDSPKRALRRIGEINRKANRYMLCRLPLCRQGSGWVLDTEGDAGMLEAGKRSSVLMRWLSEDPLLAPYLSLPSKENGFDIEGIAAGPSGVWLGLRGPTIRGYAVLLQLDLRGAKHGRLKARKLEGGRRYRKFLLDLGGLAVRDLIFDGGDLLILGGATTQADSPSRIFRWEGAAGAGDSALFGADKVIPLHDLPFQVGRDAPEALADLEDRQVLILHDRPAAHRIDRTRGIYSADVICL